MPDDLVPPLPQNEPEDSDTNTGLPNSFSDFVNGQLDLSPLAKPDARPPLFRFPPTNERDAELDFDAADLEDTDDTEDETSDNLPSWLADAKRQSEQRPATSGRFPIPSFGAGKMSSSVFGSAGVNTAKPMPLVNDPRWKHGFYTVRHDLEIYHTPQFPAPARVSVIPNAGRRLDRRIDYIRDIAPGRTAVKFSLGVFRQPLIGLIKNEEARIEPIKSWRTYTRHLWKWMHDPLNPVGSTALILTLAGALLLTLTVLYNALPGDTRASINALLQPNTVRIETQLAEQQARIEVLEQALHDLVQETDISSRVILHDGGR